MTATNQHINNLGRGNTPQTSRQNRIIKGLVKVVGWIIGLILALIVWVVVKPMIRGLGWLISIVTLLAAIYWILTL